MRRFLTLLLFFLVYNSYPSFCQSKKGMKDNTLTINGKLKNLPFKVFTVHFVYENTLDSVLVVNNTFKYVTKPFNAPFLMTMYANSMSFNRTDMDVTVFLLDGKNVNITSIDTFRNISVSGSKAYVEYKKLEEIDQSYSSKFRNLNYNLDSTVDLEKRNAIKVEINNLRSEVGLQYLNYVKQNPKSPALMYALLRAVDGITEDNHPLIRELYDGRTASEKLSRFGVKIKRKIFDNTPRVGEKAVNFTLENLAGDSVTLDKFKGKYVLLDFWASWCSPCREENKYLLMAYNKYKSKNFSILSVSADLDKNNWIKAIEKDGLVWEQVIDDSDNKAQKRYKISLFPTNFLIDPEGKIIERNLRGMQLLKVLDKRIKE